MKNWIKQLYRWTNRHPIRRLRAYIHAAGGVDIESLDDYDYPMYYQEEYRYHPIQYLVDNEHLLIVSRIKREQKKSNSV